MEISEARILRAEPDGLMLVELFAEEVQSETSHAYIVGGKGEQQPLGCVSGWIWIEDKLEQLSVPDGRRRRMPSLPAYSNAPSGAGLFEHRRPVAFATG